MTVGDVLEWLGAAAFAAAGFLWAGPIVALAVLGAVLVYEAQCYDSKVPPVHPVQFVKVWRRQRAMRRLEKKADGTQ